MFMAAAVALRHVTARALAQEVAQAPRQVRHLRSELNVVVHAPADPLATAPPPEPTIVDPDPDLEPGFPVQALETTGSYVGGAAVHTCVGNIDQDPQPEILATGLARGPLYAWKHDGRLVPGWPVGSGDGVEYPALGTLSRRPFLPPPLRVFSAGFGDYLEAWGTRGRLLPGWPRSVANYVSSPAALGDVDGNGLDEIFIGEEDDFLHAYRANGTPLPGWPVLTQVGSQRRDTPAIADLDGDGDPEIITLTEYAILAYHRDGSMVSGFPVSLDYGYPSSFPAVGDVDGDGELEIVAAQRGPSPEYHTLVRVYSHDGILKQTLTPAQIVFYGAAPALADLDGDGIPEIIVGTNGALDVWKGDGTTFPGWPQVWATPSQSWLGESAPVVGDVDGDGQPDIVITSNRAGSSTTGEVRVYDRFGTPHPRFPKVLPIGGGAVPAIADLHRDGRNEIIVSGSFWNGFTGMYDKVWVYNLKGASYGPVLWGQFMGGPRHQGRYVGPTK
jgi:VCBS repeat protein